MMKVDQSMREPWMPVWPDRVNMKALGPRFVALMSDGEFLVWPTLRELLDHFMMPRSALVEVP